MKPGLAEMSLNKHLDVDPVLPGYQTGVCIYAGAGSLVYRAIREQDRQSVILKMMNPNYPGLDELACFKREHHILNRLNNAGIITPVNTESYRGKPVLVMNDFGGISLKQLLGKWSHAGTEAFPLLDFIMLARLIIVKVAELHHLGIIHKNINPSNIVYNPDSRELALIDFGLASTLNRETPVLKNSRVLEGTPAYMSPEQTGRMNRTVDYRTDFYSLGVTFYELLTGRLPFEASDNLELVHCHLAKTPVEPHVLNPALPVVVSRMVLTLMAKTPEDRYQSTGGIIHDLSRCECHCRSGEPIPDFVLGQEDQGQHFIISEKLYGRDHECQKLLSAFDRAAHGGIELMLVTGFSGIGKTAVINEIHKPIVKRRGYFIRGKFDQYNRSIPFYGFVQAFRDLVDQLLCESQADQQAWRSKILSVLGENGQVIIDMVPELEGLIGTQHDVSELSGNAAQNRFNLMLRQFISAMTFREHPLVIFLDDLQWVDTASLQLLQLLKNEKKTGYLLLLGAYRDNEVPPAHPLAMAIEDMKKAGEVCETLTLTPLKQTDINHLVADTLDCSVTHAMPLTQLMFQKTRGNPFFCHQFLKALHAKGVLTYDPSAGHWLCDLAAVGALPLGGNVVEFMARQLRTLPNDTQEVLKIAACIGNQFDLEMLAKILQQSPGQVSRDLWPAVQDGLVSPIHSGLKFFQHEDKDLAHVTGSDLPASVFRFLHDRIQQAAYSLILKEQRQDIHLRIGQLLLSNTPDSEQDKILFEILNQLNQGSALLEDPLARREVVQLNLRAGLKAKASTAFDAAWDYFTAGRALLAEDAWKNDYDLTLKLYESSVEAAYLSGDLETMDALARIGLSEARSLTDTVKIHEVKIQSMTSRNNLLDALAVGLDVLKMLGIDFPENPSPEDIMAALEDTQAVYREKGIRELINLPVMKDPIPLMASRILTQIVPVAYIAAPQLYIPLVCKAVQLSVKHGNTHVSSHIYAAYGILILGVTRDIDASYEFGQLALDVLDRLDAKEMQCRVHLLVYAFIAHWRNPVKDSIPHLKAAYYKGLETGDLEFAGYSAILYCVGFYFPGLDKTLSAIGREASSLSESILQFNQLTAFNYFRMLLQAMHDLREGRSGAGFLKGTFYDEETMLPVHVAANDRVGLFLLFLHKLLLHFLFEEYEQACRMADQVEEYQDAATGFPMVPVYYFFDSLARLAQYPERTGDHAEVLMQRVESNRKMMAVWAAHAPVNCAYKLDLVEAERMRVLGDKGAAIDLYDRAIDGAQKNGFPRDEALANELAARFYLAWNKDRVAASYMQAAHETYARWGAMAKVKQLEERYTGLLFPKTQVPGKPLVGHGRAEHASGNTGTSLDLLSVIKASQAIAREIELERLLKCMMRIVIENAGAESGALILEHKGRWLIQAQGNADGKISVLQGLDLNASGTASARIINDVIATRQGIVLDDANHEGDYFHDPYVIRNHVKSVICAPLVNRGKLSGIVYLENNLATHAFTVERLEMIHLLSTQMALSLDNARLYRRVREEHQRIQKILDKVATPILISRVIDGKVLYANPALARVGRVNLDEYVGSHATNYIVEIEKRDAVVEQLKREGRIIDYEVQFRRGDGEIYWALLSIMLINYQDEDCLLTSFVDISGRKQVEEDVRRLNEDLEQRIIERTENLKLIKEREEFLSAIIENLPHMIFIKDAKELRFVRINRAGENLLGIPRDELIGKSAYDFFPRDVADLLRTREHKTLQQGVLLDIPEETIQTRKLGPRKLHTKKIPILDGQGHPLYLLCISEDITQRLESERLEKELKNQLRQSQKMESLGTLAGGIAHDFNNILSAIIGFTELAKGSVPQGSDAEIGLLEVINASFRASELVRQILTFSRRTQAKRVHINMKCVVREVLGLLRSTIPSSVEIEEYLENGFILGDSTQIHQVVMNLCTNAYHAMREGGGVITISLSAEDVDDESAQVHADLSAGPAMKLVVSDTGHGIEPSNLERIFEPYFTTKEKGEGTGLGLSVVHGIVKKHSGAVLVESTVNRGSTFTIFFPRVDQKEENLELLGRYTMPRGTERILFVDDEELLTKAAGMLLGKLGYDVTIESNGIDALNTFSENPSSFDLVITDLTMPKMTGDKLAVEIKAIRPDIPIILCTGYSDQMTKETTEQMGIQEFILKPLVFESLSKTIRKILDRDNSSE